MKILASGPASVNVCISHVREWPSWSTAAFGADFMVVSLMKSRLPSVNAKEKDRSKIEQKHFDLCGTAAIGEVYSCVGRLSLIVFQFMMRACPAATLSCVSAAK